MCVSVCRPDVPENMSIQSLTCSAHTQYTTMPNAAKLSKNEDARNKKASSEDAEAALGNSWHNNLTDLLH